MAFENQYLLADSISWLPATPALLVLGQKGELLYLGPYGEGLGCSENTEIPITILNNYAKGYASKLIHNQAKVAIADNALSAL